MEDRVALESHQIKTYSSSGGARVFQIPLEAFPGLWGYVYLVLVQDESLGSMKVLVDTGSGFGDSNRHLEEGLRLVSELTGEAVDLADLTHILITHGHIDHFGGLSYIRPRTP